MPSHLEKHDKMVEMTKDNLKRLYQVLGMKVAFEDHSRIQADQGICQGVFMNKICIPSAAAPLHAFAHAIYTSATHPNCVTPPTWSHLHGGHHCNLHVHPFHFSSRI
ncbi:unnamed protein product [Leptosia nina]|uniref:Uncharacterized protein n=1 Tax=Leptosia nina TaxID=320188 RepID=A0AAV1K2F0_9NEOP